MSRSWGSLVGGLRYGYKPFHFIDIEGVPTIFSEIKVAPVGGDPTPPDGYTLDASLVVDRSARVGPVVDTRTNFSAGFDLEVRLIETPAVAALMGRPTRLTKLTADVTASATTLPVDSATGYSSGETLYFGTSCAEFAGNTWTDFVGLDRDAYGPRKSYRKGTIVADRPRQWKGRRVRLWMGVLDPLGRIIEPIGGGVGGPEGMLADACMLWVGHIYARPKKDGVEWVIACRDQARRPTEPLGVSASGKASWQLDDDAPIYIDTETVVSCRVRLEDSGVLADVNVQPFIGETPPLYRSQTRALIASSLLTELQSASARILDVEWVRSLDTQSSGRVRIWELMVKVDRTAGLPGDQWGRVKTSVGSANARLALGALTSEQITVAPVLATMTMLAGLQLKSEVGSASLAVRLEDTRPSAVPQSGWLLIEQGGSVDYREYTAWTQDPADVTRLLFQLAPRSSLTGQELTALAADELAGDLAEVSVKILWRDTGTLADVARRILASSGEGINGTYDTLPKGQGYGLPYIDENSFDEQFAGAYSDLVLDLAVEGGSSAQKLLSGLLRLGGRAITTRRREDGSGVDIAAVSVGSADSGVPVARITDADLCSVDGRSPLRPGAVYSAPTQIVAKLHQLPVGLLSEAEGVVEYIDEHLEDWTADVWELDIHGLSRDALGLPGLAMAMATFRGGENRQTLELDVAPWLGGTDRGIQAGDIVELAIEDSRAYDYRLSSSGIYGLARVTGVTYSLDTGLVTVQVQADGVLSPGPMSPSLPIIAVNGTATAPTSIDVALTYLEPLTYAKGAASSWKLLAYLPGQDHGHAVYTVSTVAETGGVCRITVTASPSAPTITLTAAWRITWPSAAESTDEQNRYLHTSQLVQWS